MTGLCNTKNNIYKKKQVLWKPEISYLGTQLCKYICGIYISHHCRKCVQGSLIGESPCWLFLNRRVSNQAAWKGSTNVMQTCRHTEQKTTIIFIIFFFCYGQLLPLQIVSSPASSKQGLYVNLPQQTGTSLQIC